MWKMTPKVQPAYHRGASVTLAMGTQAMGTQAIMGTQAMTTQASLIPACQIANIAHIATPNMQLMGQVKVTLGLVQGLILTPALSLILGTCEGDHEEGDHEEGDQGDVQVGGGRVQEGKEYR